VREDALRCALIIAGSVGLLVFALAPVAWMAWISFADRPDLVVQGEAAYGLGNYVDVLTEEELHFLDYFRNSLVISLVTALAVTASASLAGYAVSRLRFRGRVLVPLAVLAVSMFPPISIVGYLHRIFSQAGLLNTHLALILPYIAFTVPLGLWINMSYFAQIPRDLDRAAMIDGAGRLRTLTHVVLPVALPGIFSSFLLVLIACFNKFLFALMLTVDYRARTLSVGIAMFQGLHGEMPWGSLMAASVLTCAPLVALTLLFQRYVVQGLSAGALKG